MALLLRSSIRHANIKLHLVQHIYIYIYLSASQKIRSYHIRDLTVFSQILNEIHKRMQQN